MTKLLRYALRHFLLVFLLGLFYAPTHATTLPHLNDTAYYKPYPYIIIISDDDPMPQLTDEEFFDQAASVVFPVNKWTLPKNNSMLDELANNVIPQLNIDSLQMVKLMFRGAASPEGSVQHNNMLGQRRVKALYEYVNGRMTFPVASSQLSIDTSIEDYGSLCLMMRRANDPDYELVQGLVDEYGQDANKLKAKMRAVNRGQLWNRLLNTYFPQLRTARFIMVLRKAKPIEPVKPTVPHMTITPIAPLHIEAPAIPAAPAISLAPIAPATPIAQEIQEIPENLPRRELLSIKTNLLLDAAYVPGYDRWCPIPNVAIEYYPKGGHFTFGASFDMPWWQHYKEHKFFQLRNYQLETRYYLRSGSVPSGFAAGKAPAFSGLYLQAYAHGGLFGICFDANRGWVGEGAGAGVGVGYVMPISKNGHWRLELGLQAGFFRCKYDPYKYENPINPDYHDDLYYYKWTGKPELFKKRQYRWNWIGPTRVGITLTYDLLYRRIQKRGASFKSTERRAAHE